MEKQFPTHIVAAFGIVENENHEILLLKHRDKEVYMFPGGQVEIGENLIDAVVRETKEEADMDITVQKLFCVTSNTCTYPGYNGYGMVPTKVVFGFTCTYQQGEYRPSDETTAHCWAPKDRVLGFLKVPDIIEKYRAYLNFDSGIQYLEYITKPQYELKLKQII